MFTQIDIEIDSKCLHCQIVEFTDLVKISYYKENYFIHIST